MYIEVDEGLPEHPKSNRLCALLKNPLAWAYVIKLWRWCCKYAKDGDLSKFEDTEIEYGIGWSGKSGQLLEAMKTAGFVDAERRVHDWMNHQGRAIERMDAAAERKKTWRLSRVPAQAAAQDGTVNGQSVDADAAQDGTRTPRRTAGVPSLTKSNQDKPSQKQKPSRACARGAAAPSEPAPELPGCTVTRAAFTATLAAASSGRYVDSPPPTGCVFKLDKPRARPDAIALATKIGTWLAAGGDGYKASIDGRNLADLDAWIAQAEAWDGHPVAANGQRGESAPTPAAHRTLAIPTRPTS